MTHAKACRCAACAKQRVTAKRAARRRALYLAERFERASREGTWMLGPLDYRECEFIAKVLRESAEVPE